MSRPHTLNACFLLFTAAALAVGEDSAYMEQNVGIMSSWNDKMTVDTLYGFTTGRACRFLTTETGSHDLYFLTGWFYGSQSANTSQFRLHLRQELLPFLAGYRYTWNVSENWSAWLGVQLGYVYSGSRQKAYGTEDGVDFHQNLGTSSNSFAAGAGTGITWRFSPKWALHAAYSVMGMTPFKRFSNDSAYPRSTHAVAGTVHAGFTMLFDDSAPLTRTKNESDWFVSIAMGMMNSNRGYENNGDQWVDSDLYGGGMTIAREVSSRSRLSQRVGFTTGYYYGEANNRYGGAGMEQDGGNTAYEHSVYSKITAIPLLATWELAYAVNSTFSLRCGLAGGVIIRKTDFDLFYGVAYSRSDASGTIKSEAREHCVRVNPALGLRLGVDVRMSERATMTIGYDFTQSFGRDAGTPSDEAGYYQAECGQVSKRNRYYALVSAGVTYRF
ncbi:MAG: PorT family protein [Akkermansiaceae bacterium]|nr:PorT family protein [Akkermansiaceae bacterium]